MSLLDFDSVNRLTRERITEETPKKERESFVEDLLIWAYALGFEEISEIIGKDLTADLQEIMGVVDKPIAGETFRDRLDGSVDDIIRVAETESHRVYETAKLNAAMDSGSPMMKRWVTVGDEKVRETHSYIEGIEVPLDAEFITYDGDRALMPGGFENPSNNIRCRCSLEYLLI